jgi:hypothetical protein
MMGLIFFNTDASGNSKIIPVILRLPNGANTRHPILAESASSLGTEYVNKESTGRLNARLTKKSFIHSNIKRKILIKYYRKLPVLDKGCSCQVLKNNLTFQLNS